MLLVVSDDEDQGELVMSDDKGQGKCCLLCQIMKVKVSVVFYIR